jgi:hypothetical protein
MYEILKTVYPKMMIGFYLTTGTGLFYRSLTQPKSDIQMYHFVSDTQMWVE